MKKAYSWMLATIQLLVFTVVFCGTTVLSSCSSEDKYSSDAKIELKSDCQETLNSILQNVKTSMEAVDFKDLKSLAGTLRDGTAKVNWPEADSAREQQVIASLQSLLDSFFESESQKTPETPWNISSLSETLQLAANAGTTFDKQANNPLSGGHKISHSFDIVVNDTLTYTITFSKEKNTGLSLGEISNDMHRQLTIGRNGTTVLTINTNKDFDANVKGNSINTTQLRMGSLDYKGMKFSLVRTQHNTDSVASNFAYTKDGDEVISIKLKGENNLNLETLLHHNAVFKGKLEISIFSDMLELKCNIDNMNKFYMAGLGLAGTALIGSSKENCQKVTDEYNTVVNSKLSLFGDEQGLVIFEPLLSDSVHNTYRPGIVLQLLPIDENSEKVILKDFMNLMGVSLNNIIEMLIGRQTD